MDDPSIKSLLTRILVTLQATAGILLLLVAAVLIVIRIGVPILLLVVGLVAGTGGMVLVVYALMNSDAGGPFRDPIVLNPSAKPPPQVEPSSKE